MKNKLSYTLDRFNLKLDWDTWCINNSFESNILSNDINIISNDNIIIISALDISSYSFEECGCDIGEYISNLIEEYYINKRNDIIDNILSFLK